MNHRSHPMPRWMAPLAAASAVLATSGAVAAAPPDPLVVYRDGPRHVSVERLDLPPTPDGLRRVRLHHPGGRTAEALVDHTALVELDTGAEGEIALRGGRLVRPLMPAIGLWLAEDLGGDGVELAARLAAPEVRARGVREAVPNLYLRVKPKAAPYTPTDPRYPGQWYFDNLHMPEAWGLSRGDAGTTIVVIDTGCDLTHPDLASKMDPGRDVVSGDDDPSPDLADSGAAHGTSCAGLAAAATDNGEGIAGGCPECRLRCVRMLSDAPVPVSADVEAFQFALQVDADVVSNSWGFVDPLPVPQPLADAINQVATTGRGGLGALVLFAAGNDDRELGLDELEAVDGVLCIGAINNFDEATPFTNYGAPVDLVAPTGTLTTDIAGPAGSDPGDYTNLFGGTSSACPVAAGVTGLLASAAPDRTRAELYDLLIETARTAPFAAPDANGHDPLYGYGIIQPPTALAVALGIDLNPPPVPEEDAASGCGCALPGGSDTAPGAGALAALLGLGAAARRRRRSDRSGSA